MKILLVTTFLLFSKFVLCQTESFKDSIEIQKKLKDWICHKKVDYCISYPKEWHFNQMDQMGVNFIITAPKESAVDSINESVNLMIQNLSGLGLDLDKFTALSVNQIQKLINNYNIIENKTIKTGKVEHQKITYSGIHGIYNLLTEQHYWIVGGKAYILTLTLSNEKDSSKQMKETGELIFNSFTVL